MSQHPHVGDELSPGVGDFPSVRSRCLLPPSLEVGIVCHDARRVDCPDLRSPNLADPLHVTLSALQHPRGDSPLRGSLRPQPRLFPNSYDLVCLPSRMVHLAPSTRGIIPYCKFSLSIILVDHCMYFGGSNLALSRCDSLELDDGDRYLAVIQTRDPLQNGLAIPGRLSLKSSEFPAPVSSKSRLTTLEIPTRPSVPPPSNRTQTYTYHQRHGRGQSQHGRHARSRLDRGRTEG